MPEGAEIIFFALKDLEKVQEVIIENLKKSYS